ncbi:MAG TPA: class I SAM-dependent methyltransferase [Verrucomicrobiota bacterium]|nr:class I SAM-dependent methyltransferase [Verrucomicrobiota bacterium]HRZ35844.1 class I SAM-dependent methyltransferase [Candidatus Paceibacterota bacterium]HRZ55671.1 class I SAM-dependent methyltransferase [Candidatus Paceibacterota bacterium]
MKPWYEELFSNYARTYDRECFTQGTQQEVDFIETEIAADKTVRILDIGCGTGRHAIELARRGYQVTGIDLSANQLARAREKALAAGVQPVFEQRDARTPHFLGAFDLALMLCEGGFSLMETDAMNFKILENAVRALRHGGKFMFTCLNGLFPLARSVKDFVNAAPSGVRTLDTAFDLSTLRMRSQVDYTDDDGVTRRLDTDERHYIPSELTWYMHTLGMWNVSVFGCTAGDFRKGPPTPEHFELLVIADMAREHEGVRSLDSGYDRIGS